MQKKKVSHAQFWHLQHQVLLAWTVLRNSALMTPNVCFPVKPLISDHSQSMTAGVSGGEWSLTGYKVSHINKEAEQQHVQETPGMQFKEQHTSPQEILWPCRLNSLKTPLCSTLGRSTRPCHQRTFSQAVQSSFEAQAQISAHWWYLGIQSGAIMHT